MLRWDDYVDDHLGYLKHQFQLKFYDKGSNKFFTVMNFVDVITLSYKNKKYTPRMLIACILYLIIGGKDIMCAF